MDGHPECDGLCIVIADPFADNAAAQRPSIETQ